jgi:ribose transport system substrate-binding protein
MLPQRKLANRMPSQRIFRWLSTVLALALILNACASRSGRPTVTRYSLPISSATSPATGPTPTGSVLDTAAETAIPAVTPAAATSVPESMSYHNLPARVYRGQRPYRFGLLAGSDDSFFATLARGGQRAAVNLGIELYTQFPQNWQPAEQNQMLDALLARGDLDALLVASADPKSLLPTLQKAADAGILLVMIQTGLPGESVALPQFMINTDDHMGGFLACQALANALIPPDVAASKTPIPSKKVYIQTGKLNLFDAGARAQGCKDALTQSLDIELVGEDVNGGDNQQASQHLAAALDQTPDLSAIFCTDSVCVQAASQILLSQGLNGKVKVAAMDADPAAVDLLRKGAIDFLTTPKPADMGYLAVMAAGAVLDGVTSLPSGYIFTIGWETLTSQSLDDPASTRWLYDSQTGSAQAAPPRTTAGLKIAFVAGVEDPFYYTMQRGAQLAAANLGATLISQFPVDWSPSLQTQVISEMFAKDPFQALLVVPTDPQALLPALQPVSAAGVPILALDTAFDPSFPLLASLRSDDTSGGGFACRSLAQAVGGRGKFYIQNVTPGIPATDARERGCQDALSQFPGITLLAINYNDDDPAKAQAQLATVLQNYPDLTAVFSTNVLGAQAMGQFLSGQGLSGKVKVAAFDATATAIDLLRSGLIDMVVAQEPADMGYLAVIFAAARLDGVTDLPTIFYTDYVILTRDNMDDTAYSRYFYTK